MTAIVLCIERKCHYIRECCASLSRDSGLTTQDASVIEHVMRDIARITLGNIAQIRAAIAKCSGADYKIFRVSRHLGRRAQLDILSRYSFNANFAERFLAIVALAEAHTLPQGEEGRLLQCEIINGALSRWF